MPDNYTPGPWEIIQLPSMEYRIDAKVGPLHVCPAIAHGVADARLIAAAPDLHAALRAWVESTSRAEQTGSMRPVYDAAKAALFKVA
jgi:hypothetical protein